MWPTQWQLLLIPGSIFSFYVVRRLRFYRSSKLPSRFGYADRASYSRMTVEDAWKIHSLLVEYEFPTTFSAATMFALFNSYGIPSISSLLCLTGQFANKDTADKRYADTGCLLLEAVLNPISSPRAIEALARINYLHSSYRASGKITDADMLYTLSLFALQPSRWVSRYEWRELTNLETCAVGTLWKWLGKALGVNFDLLPGSKTGWRDGIEWLVDLDSWSLAYEDAHMVPTATNQQVAEATIDLILWKLPTCLKPVGKKLVATVLEDKLREAMMIDRPSHRYFTFFHSFIALRKFILLHLTLPRLRPKKRLPTRTSSGRFYARKYRVNPWYVKPTVKNRWGPSAWMSWMTGGILPGDQGTKFFPQGFAIAELGPTPLRGSGRDQMEAEKGRIVSQATSQAGRCPFLA